MTDQDDPERFRLLATFIAGRSVAVAAAPAGVATHTDGDTVFVTSGASVARQHREVLLHSGLLGAHSLDGDVSRALRARPSLSRRYLVIEGCRVLGELVDRVPAAGRLEVPATPLSTCREESLRIARSRARLPDPPEWFGVIARRPPRGSAAGSRAKDDDLTLDISMADDGGDDPDGDGEHETSRILKLFETPIAMSETMGDLFRRLLGSGRSSGADDTGGGLSARATRRTRSAGPEARPTPTRIRFTAADRPGAAVGVGGAWFPEWDVFGDRYRADWCRVLDFPLATTADVAASGVVADEVLRRRLALAGLSPRRLRRQPDGDDLDVDALIDAAVDLRTGHSPTENVHTDARRLARELGVLILVDASGSATDTDGDGLAVHDHQRRAAATIAATLEELGDRVAVYAFRSQGRHAVHLPSIKAFDQRFGAASRARVNQLAPSGYTRLGAGIRGAGEILQREAGTPNRLLLVLSDGFPYDDRYEGRYAEADVRRALEDLRADGVACLCLSLGGDTDAHDLEKVFGSAGYASAASLDELSPRMDELFLSALRELASAH